MRLLSLRRLCGILPVALLSAAPGPLAADTIPIPVPRPTTITSAATPAAMAAYRRKFIEYALARQDYEAKAKRYWDAIAAKRRERFRKRRHKQQIRLDDYVLSQPPVYTGPPRPIDPSVPPEKRGPRPRTYIPVVADFLQSAAKYFNFVPQRPQSEIEFKRAYVKVATAAGLTKDQIVRIYVFETGGNGNYDLQAGLEYRKNARAISPALGYNQLLSTNSVSLLAEKGEKFVKALHAKAAASRGARRQALENKIAVLKRMIAFSRTVPVRWSAHDKLAKTVKGYGVHALLLDIDIGPLLQTQKLVDSVVFARRKGYHPPLSAAELEMMNLTGDGNGFDIVAMPEAMRAQVPTSNFFQRRGYERNPVAQRNNTVAKLLAASNAVMARGLNRPGARQLADVF